MVGLKVALTLAEEKKKQIEEEVGVERKQAVEAFKSSKDMKEIKIAFAREAFLEGFEVCMRRVVKNFLKVDLDLLTNKPNDEVGPSNACADACATSPIADPTLETFELTIAVLEPAQE